MLSLLERSITSIDRRLVLLAPRESVVPGWFKRVQTSSEQHQGLVREVQRLRGSVYLHDGAVLPEQLSTEGLHQTPEDERSWHLLMLDRHRRVSACAWYLEHSNPTSIDNLRVRSCPLTKHESWRDTLRDAIKSELRRAREAELRYAEVGGWAVARESRCKSEGLLLALAAYSLGRAFGGALGLTTATVRHSSSTILRRLGGLDLEAGGVAVPAYFDPKYDCQMELLRFDSRRPNPKYSGLIDLIKQHLANVAVFTSDRPASHVAAACEVARPTFGGGPVPVFAA